MNYFGSNNFSIGSEDMDERANDFDNRMINRRDSGESSDGA